MFATPALAQTAGAPAADAGLFGSIGFFAPIALILLVYWFLILRPQSQRAKAQRETIEAARKGDEVTTAGGIVGKVTKADAGDLIEVEIAQGVRVRVVKSTLIAIAPRGSAKPAND